MNRKGPERPAWPRAARLRPRVVVGAKKALVSPVPRIHHPGMSRSSSLRRVRTPAVLVPALAPALALALTGLAARTGAAAPLQSRPYGHALGDGLRAQLELQDAPGPVSPAKVCAKGETTFGIDVSYYQGDIDWNAVAASGVVFAWVRVSHSTNFEDPKFAANLAGARAAGIHTGVYQYFEPSEDPIAQADLLLNNLGPLMPGDMPPMIDVESQDPVAPGAYADAIQAWLDHIEQATGVVPFIYTGYYYWNDNVASDAFAGYPLWIANYGATCPLVPDAWASWTMHQYCDCGDVPGISGNVDVDKFNGTADELLGYAVGGAVCGDAKCVFGEDPVGCPSDCPPCGVIAPSRGLSAMRADDNWWALNSGSALGRTPARSTPSRKSWNEPPSSGRKVGAWASGARTSSAPAARWIRIASCMPTSRWRAS